MLNKDASTFRHRDLALIKNIAINCKIFIDTCSLLDDNYIKLEKTLFSILQQENVKLIVPKRVYDELKKHKENEQEEKEYIRKQAAYALKSLANQQRKGLIDLMGDENDDFADNVFSCQFTRHRMQHKLALITQDVGLAHDILKLNSSVSQKKAFPVSVFRITKYGTLGINSGDIERQKAFRGQPSQPSTTQPNPITKKKFYTLKSQITTITNDKIPVQHIPHEGEQITGILGKTPYTLVKKIAAGGEGIVYTTNDPALVCKIYNSKSLTKFRMEKLKKMVGNGFQYPGICWPVDVVLNKANDIVGFLMPKAEGIELQKSIFIPPLLKKHFGSWAKKDTVQLALTVLDKIKYLHDNNIIIGDINPLNILVKSPREVYFVDTDSYQIEEFPCTVGTINFSAPEIQGKDFKDFLRTFGDEHFAVATLLFMLMLPGKPPYAQQGGADPSTNIRNMDFSYPLGTKTNRKQPLGAWRFCWSHLPYNIKEAFYETLQRNGRYATPKTRLNVVQWIALFEEYLHLLTSGKFLEQDRMANDLFPTRFKNASNATLIACTLCKQELPEDRLVKGYCQDCLKKGVETPCKKCSNPIFYSNYKKFIEKKNPFEICSECYQKQAETYTTITCCDCYSAFTITNGEKDFYDSKGMHLPKRCGGCRKQKASLSTNTTRASYTSTPHTSFSNVFSQIFKLFK